MDLERCIISGSNFTSMINLILLALLAASAASVYGLVAVWAGMGRAPWGVRAATVSAAIGAFIPVPAFDLAVVFLIQVLTAATPLWMWLVMRSMKRKKMASAPGVVGGGEQERAGPTCRFSLLDLFLLALVAAAIACLAAYLPQKHEDFWPSYMAVGAGLGTVTLAATVAALGHRLRWLRWSVLLAVGAGVSFALRVVEGPEELSEALFNADTMLGPPAPPAWFEPAVIGSSALLIVLCLGLLRSSGWLQEMLQLPSAAATTQKSAGCRKRRPYQLAVSAALALLLLLPLKAYLEILLPPAVPAQEMPTPNGYDILARLGSELKQPAALESESPTENELRAFVTINRERLDAARAALDLPHLVPVDYETNNLDVKQFSDLRQLSRAFVNEGDLYALDKKTEAAAQCYVDTIRVARVIDEGGLL